jgi:hypothetical protein
VHEVRTVADALSGGSGVSRTRAKRRLTAALILVPLLLVLTACSGQSGDDPGIASAEQSDSPSASANPATEAPAEDAEERLLQFTRCLREQGIDVPDSPDQLMSYLTQLKPQERNAAFEKCGQYAPSGQHASLSEEEKAQRLEYVRCLRAQGVEIQDPDPATGRFQMDDQHRFLEPDAELAEAMEACTDKAPQRLRK